MSKVLVQSRRSLAGLGFAGALLFAANAAAHTVWLQPDATLGVYRVYFGGHAGKLESYPADKLKSADAYDASGKRIDMIRTDAADGVRLRPAREAALIAMHYENGIWARTPEGRSVNKTMDEVPGSKQATNAVKYHKTILQWTPFVTQTLGQPFEVTPLDAKAPRAGESMRVRVTIDGKPVQGIKIGRDEEGSDGVTDADGVTHFVPAKGFNKLWSGQRTKVSGNPKFTEFSYEYLLGFYAE